MSEREALASLHSYARWTLLGMPPIMVGTALLTSVANRVDQRALVLLVVGGIVLSGLHMYRQDQAITDPTRAWPWWRAVVTLVPATAVMVVAVRAQEEGAGGLWAALPAMSVHELTYGRAPATAWRIAVPCALGVGTVAALASAEEPGATPFVALGVTLLVCFLQFAELTALRQWRLAVELDQARRDAAELGATRERLRVAEDLHDILGHALEVVSLKSELATRLATVDPERAHAEMAEVRRLAGGALKDVRALVQGRRSTHLDVELAGARGLLDSAGIDCEFDLPADRALDDDRGELLGRVLREAVTNLLRHADTHRCWVTLRVDGGAATLRVVNDGVLDSAAAGDGTGLKALDRRVRAAGGRFSAGPGERGRFEVEAVLP